MTKLSIIIPTLNEAEYLPSLLKSLNEQTVAPYEIIVADAGSKDNTRELAKKSNAIVVDGGMPGVGRNAGASIAQGSIYLFLDADVLPPANFIEYALEEFQRRDLDIATCSIEAISDDIGDNILMDATNLYMQLIMPVSPRAPGFCIFARRKIHHAIGGFDETLKMSEDHDYVRRASKHGKFKLLKSVKIPISMRRLKKEGHVNLAIKYLWCEMYALAGQPIRSMPFEYEFGVHRSKKSSKTELLTDVEKLRKILGKSENPIMHLSKAGLKRLDQLTKFNPVDFATQSIHLLLGKHDAEILENYLKKRLEVLAQHKKLTPPSKKARKKSKEMIRIIDLNQLQRLFRIDKSRNDGDKKK
jgi:glycosyltransferase involved in cell wall biosynthesis